MTQEIEPGSREALYDEIRRRIMRRHNRDRIDAYQGAVRTVRESLTRTSDHTGAIMGNPIALWTAGILTVLLATAAVFITLNPDWRPTQTRDAGGRFETLAAD